MTTTLVYTGEPCHDCDMERLFYGSCSQRLADACAGKTASVAPPTQTTGGVGSAPAPTNIPTGSSCSSCRKSAPSGPAAPAGTPGTVSRPGARRVGYPWWVIVLAVMILAQVVSGGKANGVG